MMAIEAPTAVPMTHGDDFPLDSDVLVIRRESQPMCVDGFWQLQRRESKERSLKGGGVRGEGRGGVRGGLRRNAGGFPLRKCTRPARPDPAFFHFSLRLKLYLSSDMSSSHSKRGQGSLQFYRLLGPRPTPAQPSGHVTDPVSPVRSYPLEKREGVFSDT